MVLATLASFAGRPSPACTRASEQRPGQSAQRPRQSLGLKGRREVASPSLASPGVSTALRAKKPAAPDESQDGGRDWDTSSGRYFVDPGLPEREPDREQQSSSGEGLELSIPQVFLAVALGPVVLSTCIRVAIMDPLLFFAQADWANFELTENQRTEIAEKLEHTEKRMKYEMRIGRAPKLNHHELEEKLREEGHRLEAEERERSRAAVGNAISDSLCFVLVGAGVLMNRNRLTLVRQGIYKRFLSLDYSTQAFTLLLMADLTVGYHSSDGWVTFLEMFYGRYTLHEPEETENAIRLFVATVPVVVDVAFKFWVYKYLRKLAPGTQIILSEIERH